MLKKVLYTFQVGEIYILAAGGQLLLFLFFIFIYTVFSTTLLSRNNSTMSNLFTNFKVSVTVINDSYFFSLPLRWSWAPVFYLILPDPQVLLPYLWCCSLWFIDTKCRTELINSKSFWNSRLNQLLNGPTGILGFCNEILGFESW